MKTLLALICAAMASSALAGESKGALANLLAVPAEFKNGIIKLSADGCDPNPDIWYIAAKSKNGGFREIEMASGQVVSSKPSLGLRETFSSNKPIDVSKIEFDSRDAFELAQRYAKANNKTIGSVSFVLTQQGTASVPVWYAWCYGPRENYFGQMQFLASDGTVISNDAFPKKP